MKISLQSQGSFWIFDEALKVLNQARQKTSKIVCSIIKDGNKEIAIIEKPLRRVLFELRQTETKNGHQVNIEGALSDSRAKRRKFPLESA